MKKRSIRIALCSAAIIFLCGGLLSLLIYNGVILLNNPSDKNYPVKGVDVSSYQGDIDWSVLEAQNIKFAFIKATEGSGFVDPMFRENYGQAQKTALRVGAYHFFSYDSSGKTQAEHFISVVPKTENMLPPVIDVEFYGDNEKHPPASAAVKKELSAMIETLKEHYGRYPVIYAVKKSYDLYIADAFSECDIWIRDIIFKPRLSDRRAWTFWQYTNRKKLEGYNGKEKFIDMNVFHGTTDDFNNYAK